MNRNFRIKLSPPDLNFLSEDIAGYFPVDIHNIEVFEDILTQKIGAAHALALNSGTSALHLSLILADVREGDEVICPDFTFAATVNAILYQRATPILVDSERVTWNMDPELLKHAIEDRIKLGKRPKAVIVVHAYGMPADVQAIALICEKYGIALIEDAAGALGSSVADKPVGTWGKMGIFSFNLNKIVSTGGGGALVTNNPEINIRAKYLANQARLRSPYYEHEELGFNYVINPVGVTLALGHLRILEEKVKRRREIFNYYKTRLKDISSLTFLEEKELIYSNRWLTTVLVKKAELMGLKNKFDEKGIEVRFVWKPMHTQPAYSNFPAYLNGTSLELFNSGLCLPSGNNLSLQEQDEIISVLFDFFNN